MIRLGTILGGALPVSDRVKRKAPTYSWPKVLEIEKEYDQRIKDLEAKKNQKPIKDGSVTEMHINVFIMLS